MAIACVLRDGMHIDNAEQAVHFRLHPHPVFERAQIIAQMQRVGRLHTRKDKWTVHRGHCERPGITYLR